MRARSSLVGLMIGLLSAGCTLVENGATVLPYKVRESLADCAERRRNRHWAEQAWEQEPKGQTGGRDPADYGDGFKDGFADFLYAGGDGEPPPLPPNKYRALCYQTPKGYQAVEDWFAGYRRGASVARDGGYRQWVIGPSSLPPALPLPSPSPSPLPAPVPVPVEELAPLPRPLPPPVRSPAPEKEEPRGAVPVRVPVHIAVEHREPSPPPPPRVEEETPAVPLPAPPADVRARFRRELNQWEIVWYSPDGRARTTVMSPEAFSEMIERVTRQNKDGPAKGGRHAVLIDNDTNATAMDIDDRTFAELAARLRQCSEKTGQ